MEQPSEPTQLIEGLIRDKLGDRRHQYQIPPPVFTAMEGDFLSFDQEAGVLSVRFPILGTQLNPYGSVQGGVLAAAVDNTVGPLSLLVAPPNVTRRLEVTYSRPVTPELGYIDVTAEFVERHGRWLTFRAQVRDLKGNRLARAIADHWIVAETGEERISG